MTALLAHAGEIEEPMYRELAEDLGVRADRRALARALSLLAERANSLEAPAVRYLERLGADRLSVVARFAIATLVPIRIGSQWELPQAPPLTRRWRADNDGIRPRALFNVLGVNGLQPYTFGELRDIEARYSQDMAAAQARVRVAAEPPQGRSGRVEDSALEHALRQRMAIEQIRANELRSLGARKKLSLVDRGELVSSAEMVAAEMLRMLYPKAQSPIVRAATLQLLDMLVIGSRAQIWPTEEAVDVVADEVDQGDRDAAEATVVVWLQAMTRRQISVALHPRFHRWNISSRSRCRWRFSFEPMLIDAADHEIEVLRKDKDLIIDLDPHRHRRELEEKDKAHALAMEQTTNALSAAVRNRDARIAELEAQLAAKPSDESKRKPKGAQS